MMLCVIAGQFGLVLALPSVFTLACLVLGVWAVTAQVGVEKQLLGQRFGAAYAADAAHTPVGLVFDDQFTDSTAEIADMLERAFTHCDKSRIDGHWLDTREVAGWSPQHYFSCRCFEFTSK